MTTPQEVLAGVPLFSMLPKEEVAKLAQRAHELTVPAGTVVTDMDSPGASFGVIVDGRAAVSVHGQPIRALGPGDYFGEMAVIDDSHRYRSAKITPTLSTSVITVPAGNVSQFAARASLATSFFGNIANSGTSARTS